MPIFRKKQDEDQEQARADQATPDVTDLRFRARPDLWRPPGLKPGQWRYDPEFARDINPHTFREKGGYGRGRR